MTTLHIHRSSDAKANRTSDLLSEKCKMNKNVVQCLYNLMQEFKHHKILSPDLVYKKLELVFDIDQIEDQALKLSESVLGQCVQQIEIAAEANTLASVICKYIYTSRVAADRVKPGTSVPTVGYYTIDNKIKMHDPLQIMSKVDKQLIQRLSGIYEELLKAGDISSVSNTNAVKQNALASYYEHLDYQTKAKNKGMHAGMMLRLLEQLWDRSPPLYALPTCIKDFSRQNAFSLMKQLLDTTNKFTFGLCKYGSKAKVKEILDETANCWRINTDNSLSKTGCEANIKIENENIPISGVVILTDNLKVKLQSFIFSRNTDLRSTLVTCDVHLDDFNPQKAFITDGKIKMDSTNLFIKNQKQLSGESMTKKVEFINMGSECFAIHMVDSAYYQNDTSAQNRFREVVKVDFMMPLLVQFDEQCSDDLFKKENFDTFVVPTKVYFKDQSGISRCISSCDVLPFITGMLNSLNDFQSAVTSAVGKLSKTFKLQHIMKGGEKSFVEDQYQRSFKNLYHTFPMHYYMEMQRSYSTADRTPSELFENIHQKPLWIMTGGLTYQIVLTNIISLWKQHGFSQAIFEPNKLGRHSLFKPNDESHYSDNANRLAIHGVKYVKSKNPTLYSWIADHGRKLKHLLKEKMQYPNEIDFYVEFVIYLLNSEQLYKQVFSTGSYHPGLGFVLNRTEKFETESLLLSRIQGYKLFYSQTTTEAKNDCQSPHYSLITSMQTGHMTSSLTHPCVRYPHCIITDHGTMGTEILNSEFVFGKQKPSHNYDIHCWIPIFSPCEMSEAMFEDSFNPFGRSNVFYEELEDYFNPDTAVDPLTGVAGYNLMSLGLLNLNFVIYSDLFETHSGFSLKRHVIPNQYVNFWFNDYQINAKRGNDFIHMRNLQENIRDDCELKLQYDDLALLLGGSVSKFCYSHPKMIKSVMTEKGGGSIPGRNVYRWQNDYLVHGSKLMENFDRGVNINDRYLLA